MQTRALRKNGVRAAVIAALMLLTAAILYMGLHSGDLGRLWSALYNALDGKHAVAEPSELPMVKPAAPAASDDSAWQDWMEHGKAFSSGISQVIEKHVPGVKAAVAQTVAQVDNAIRGAGPHPDGSYSFVQTTTVVPGGGGSGWFYGGGGGGGGCWGPDCGGHPPPPDCHKTNTCGPPPDCHDTNTCPPPPDCHDTNTCPPPPDCHETNTCPPPPDCHDTNTCPPPPDCHETNTCPPPPDCHETNSCPPPPDCHQTNTCPPPPDCHQTNTCPPVCNEGGNCNPHPVDESDSLALLGGGLLTLLWWTRRRKRRLGEAQLLHR